MPRNQSPLLELLFLLPALAAAQQIDLTVAGIPAAATRVVAVVDGGALSGPLRTSRDVLPGAGMTTLSLGVPPGGPYRVRAIAFTSGGTFPAVLRSGEAGGVAVGATPTAASLTLTDIGGAVDASTPSTASAGNQATITIDIGDPGDFLSGLATGRLWSGTSPPAQNLAGTQTTGALRSLGSGNYQFAAAVNLPATGGVLSYQFGEASPDFANPDGTEFPFLVWPNVQTGPAAQVVSSITSGINVSIDGIPAAATRVVAVVDGGAITGTLWSGQDFLPGLASTTLSLGVPPGGPYRVRAIAFTGGVSFPALLRSGAAGGIAVGSGVTGVSVTLADVSGVLDASTPASAAAGSPVTIAIDLTDPGDFLSGLSQARLWSGTTPPVQNLAGVQTEGVLTSLGNGRYRFEAVITLPTTGGVVYYQFGEAAPAFANSDSTEFPFLAWPNLPAAAPAQITTAVAAGISLSVGGIPAQATRVIAVVDGGGISRPLWTGQDVLPGAATAAISLGVPSGGPYRVRVIAFTGGTPFPAVLRSGKTAGVLVGAGLTSAAVTLADVSGWLNALTPNSASTGSLATIAINLSDPGDFLAGLSAGRLWSGMAQPSQNLSGAQSAGTLLALGGGSYQFTATVSLPTASGVLYYQFGEAAPAFDSPNGTEAPFLVWPNLGTGSPDATLVVSLGTSYSRCDINQKGSVDVSEVQQMIHEALGWSAPDHDLTLDGAVNLVDVQMVLNAALQMGCAAPPNAAGG